MKQILLLVVSLPCLLLVARAQTSRDAEAEIRDLEQQRFQAMEHVDVAALNRILSDDLVYTHSSGLEQTKGELIGVLGSGDFKYESISAGNTRIRIYDDTAVVTGRATMKIKSGQGEQTLKLCYLDVYVKQEGRWQMVAWQSSHVEP